MNEKERIFELVRNNVISLEEALDLLESAGRHQPPVNKKANTSEAESAQQTPLTDSEPTTKQANPKLEGLYIDLDKAAIKEAVNKGKALSKGLFDSVAKMTNEVVNEFKEEYQKEVEADQADQDFVAEYQTAQQEIEDQLQTPESKEDFVNRMKQVAADYKSVNEAIKALKEANIAKEEAVVIAKQRLRELEVLAELDELSPEMVEQQQKYQVKLAELETGLASYRQELESLKGKRDQLLKDHLHADEMKQFVNDTTETVGETASRIGTEASRSGKIISKIVKRTVSDVIKQVKVAGVDINFGDHRYKTSMKHSFSFTEPIQQVDIRIQQDGDVYLTTWDEAYTLIEADLFFMDAHENPSVADFEEKATVAVVDNCLIFHTNDKRISANLTIKVPTDALERLACEVNRNVKLEGINLRETAIQTLLGNVQIINSQIALLDIQSVNGNILVEDCEIDDIVAKNVNGNYRQKGPIGNISLKTVNSNVLLTKEDLDPSVFNLMTTNGAIKIALDKRMALDAQCQTAHGSVKERLSEVQLSSVSSKQRQLQRYLGTDKPLVKVEARTTNGNILLKDLD